MDRCQRPLQDHSLLGDLSGQFLPAPLTAREGLFCLRFLIMLFAETICNAFEERETPLASDAGQRSISSVPRSVRM